MQEENQRYHEKNSGQDNLILEEVSFPNKIVCFLVCMIPLTLGFIIPVSILLKFVFSGLSVIDFNAIFQTTFYSISLATLGALIVMIVSFLMMLVSNYKSNSFQKILIFLSSCGYAFPGTILAVGIVVFVGWLNELIYFHLSYTLGGLLVLLFAYTTRFLAVGKRCFKVRLSTYSSKYIGSK